MIQVSIDVVIPVYNGEAFLEQTIGSVLGQSHSPHRIYVVDDGSTDASRSIAKKFGDPVVCLAQVNQGPSAARNLGVSAASSEWIAFLDADDYWMPDRLEKLAELVEIDPLIDLLYTGLNRISPNGSVEEVWAKSPQWTRKQLAYGCPILPSTVMVRRALLLTHPWSLTYRSSEDWWFFYSLSRQARFGYISEPSVYYRLHDESLTHRDWRSVLHYATKVSARIQKDFSGFERVRLRRKVDSRLFASAAIAAREEDPGESIRLAARSLAVWPLPGHLFSRCKLLLALLLRMKSD